jgi:ABC-type antimicrobial peptide transport system permease subunit
MGSTGFPINDLLRRRLQTGLTITTLTLSVASTLFLLLFSSRLGVVIPAETGKLTLGLNLIFGQFILFIGVLIFVIGAVLTSFIVFLMMTQRTRDFGLIKAAGCPNSLVAGYFMTELLTVIFVGSVLGIIFGFLADFAVSNLLFAGYSLPNFLFAPLVFVAFFVLAFFFGLQPILKASRLPPIKALSPAIYYGLTVGPKHKALSRSGLSWRIATRSLIRRQSASLRIIILLSIVFLLLTISVAGGLIASGTTTSWVQRTLNSDTIGIAHISMANQYKLLSTKFSGAKETGVFNYSNPDLAIPAIIVERLNSMLNVGLVDSRLIVKGQVREVSNFTIDPDTLETFPVGDSRQGEAIIVGVYPNTLVGEWSVKGRFLNGNNDLEAVVGDSISQTMYSPHPNSRVVLGDPLRESISFQNTSFGIVGVCIDPINNGFVAYVKLDQLKNATGLFNPNLLLVKLNDLTERDTVIAEIKSMVQALDPDLNVFDLKASMAQNADFLSSTWQTIMFLPLFTLAAAALCLVGYVMLVLDEQHQEFAILRMIGARSSLIVVISSIQSAIVLISSFATGLSLGVIVTLLILIRNPVVTNVTILEIAALLAVAIIAMFLLSLIPAFRIARTSILKILT